MVIADDAELGCRIVETLDDEGFVALCVSRRDAAALERLTPDLVICELGLATPSDVDALERVRARPALASAPFIFLAGTSERSVQQRLVHPYAGDQLIARYTRVALIEALRAWFDRKQGGVARSGPRPGASLGHERPPLAELKPTAIFAREYEVGELIGDGGMGAVYKVRQRSTGRWRALKIMRSTLASDARSIDRFVQEAVIGSRIASDHVVEVINAGFDEASGAPYIVMELLDGETLEARVHHGGPFDVDQARGLLAQLCHALGAAHRAGVVHRDLKPSNVFLHKTRREGERGVTVKLLDMGIAKLHADAPLTGEEPTERVPASARTGALGTPLWMAPEQTYLVTPSADMWALGLLAFYCLVGRPYWRVAEDDRASLRDVLDEVCSKQMEPASVRATRFGHASLPQGFDAWFARCVQSDHSARFLDASQAWTALLPILAEGPEGR